MTRHSVMRTMERADKTYASAVKFIGRAREKGIYSFELPSRERRYMEQKQEQGRFAVFYQGYVFIFSAEFGCITMYAAPDWFLKKGRFDGKTEIRNQKKYAKYYRQSSLYANQW